MKLSLSSQVRRSSLVSYTVSKCTLILNLICKPPCQQVGYQHEYLLGRPFDCRALRGGLALGLEAGRCTRHENLGAGAGDRQYGD